MRIYRCLVLLVILANVLFTNIKTRKDSFFDKSWALNNEGPFLITETATPNEASQCLNPRVRG
jgi:hypothetical protein